MLFPVVPTLHQIHNGLVRLGDWPFGHGLGVEHLAIVKGDINPEAATLVRVHTECVMGDVFGSLRTKSGEYLQAALRVIDQAGSGVLLYLRTEDMGGRLMNRIQAYADLDEGKLSMDEMKSSFAGDNRDYGVGAQILRELGVRKINLITNSQAKRVGLKGYGIEIVDSTAVTIGTAKNSESTSEVKL